MKQFFNLMGTYILLSIILLPGELGVSYLACTALHPCFWYTGIGMSLTLNAIWACLIYYDGNSNECA